ncbi:hypothetical protein WKW58_23210 [Vibrio alginolyticus]|uniref:hypothetical protein n=1 Tax=Vibrio alginolyticus TaxID=663 RepID=UPI00375409AE
MFEKLIVVVLGGLVGFFLTLIKELTAEKKSKAAETYYLTILVSSSIEQFIVGCSEVVADNGTEDQDGYTYYHSQAPSFAPLDLDVDWKILPPDLLYSLLSLPQLIHEANAYISAVSEYAATPPDFAEFYEARTTKYAALGLLAIQMSDQLRELGGLPKRKVEEWGDRQTFLLAIHETEEREVMRQEFRQKMLDSMKDQVHA